LQLSGVERLLTFARDLEVEPARAPRRPTAAEAAERTTARRTDQADGIKLELSSGATEPPGTSAVSASTVPPIDASAPSPESSVPAARGTALDAYQRQAAQAPGQRVSIRA